MSEKIVCVYSRVFVDNMGPAEMDGGGVREGRRVREIWEWVFRAVG